MLRGGYPYLLGLRQTWGRRTGEIRLLGRRTLVVSGSEGARLFYDGRVMRRSDAIPPPLASTLFGDGAVHGLDGAQHHQRKAMFRHLLSDDAAREIAARAAARWSGRSVPITPREAFDAAVVVHGTAVCSWAGIGDDEVDESVCRDLATVVDGFGGLGPRHLRARRARRRLERWARGLLAEARSSTPTGTALSVIAAYRDVDGEPLMPEVAAVELLNVLRPTVAVAFFVAFAAQRLADDRVRDAMVGADDARWESFAHELRRISPFVPMLAARADRPTEHDGCPVPAGRRVVLDVYGTLHDPDLWRDPERFDAERFLGAEPDAWTYYPQGAGSADDGHRCPGERVTVELITTAGRVLASVPQRGGSPAPLTRFPTRPR